MRYRGCADKMLPVNLRDYMTFGPRFKLTRDFGELVARLETLTIKRERFTHASKEFQSVNLRQFVIKYSWITAENIDYLVDVDRSHSRLIKRLDRLLGVGGERTIDREPLTQEGATRVKVSFTWTAIEDEVLSASNVTKSDMKKWVSSFTRKRKDECCYEL
ncbi:uncharacterized protein EAF02_011528 [Botrytis sinoallii]|uniref:uncharacterized protein n=1 Tax=Botrytis sinoallii TaxID=1463999 RepID=UPI0018FF6520|nr:uncharacterized protein EAF02_011528 [Botrytis sinoallii]KAF7855269.1 hypothetical protein EAF02_011528 [Botrytis sinoallii]